MRKRPKIWGNINIQRPTESTSLTNSAASGWYPSALDGAASRSSSELSSGITMGAPGTVNCQQKNEIDAMKLRVLTSGHFAELGTLPTLVKDAFSIAKVIPPTVRVVSYSFHALWQTIIVLYRPTFTMRICDKVREWQLHLPHRTVSSVPWEMVYKRWSHCEQCVAGLYADTAF